jgi:TPR repeat protein
LSQALVNSPFDRVAQVRVRRSRGTVIGSGYLVSDHLLLTARHVVSGPGQRRPRTVDVEFLSGITSIAEPAWLGNGELDVSLLWIEDPPVAPNGVRISSVRWGRLTGQRTRIRAGAVGFPRVMQTVGGVRIPDNVSGTINPARALGERYDLHLDGAIPASRREDRSVWSGLSGASLFADVERLLIGVVVLDHPDFAGQVLTAVPSWRLLEDEKFSRWLEDDGCATHCESVELTGLFTPPTLRYRGRLAPSRLLDADSQVVPFRGRESLLADLNDWCRTERPFDTKVLTGPGGQGKTRLAMEFVGQMSSQGWVTGFVQPRAPRRIYRLVPQASVPLLLIVDYAETRTDQLEQLIRTTWSGRPQTRVRIVLIARTEAEWWERLRRTNRDALEAAKVKALPSLEDEPRDRIQAFRAAVDAFANHLASEVSPTWTEHGEDPHLPPLEEPQFASVLTLHMTALGMLLQRGNALVDETEVPRPEDLLLEHERRYWEDAAAQRGLQPDQRTLRLAVASAAFLGARTRREAVTTLGLVPGLGDTSEGVRGAVADWLHDLYPPSDDRYWGSLEPDTLGERLIQLVNDGEEGLVATLLEHASHPQRGQAVAVVARIAGRLHRDEQDPLASSWWYAIAADYGHAEAAYQRGWIAKSAGDPRDAEHWWRIAARSGHLDATFHLAKMLEDQGQTGSFRSWYEQAARGGHLDAAFHLGELSDRASAEEWYKLAAEGGHKRAAYNLGWLLKHRGCPEHAIKWWDTAALEMPEAASALADELAVQGDLSGARYWYQSAAEKGWNSARIALARMTLDENDLDLAASWLEPADQEDQLEATVLLAEICWRQAKRAEARALYEKAWNAGDTYSGYQLGWWWWQQGQRDIARGWWQKAADQGDTRAISRLSEDF